MSVPAQTDVVSLDRYERQILIALQADSRLSNQDLARKVGLSPSACWRRVKGLEEAGVILRYTAILDPKKCAGNRRSWSVFSRPALQISLFGLPRRA